MNDAEWLAWLHKEIWKISFDRGPGVEFWTEKRKLAPEEFARLEDIAKKHHFVMAPHNGNMGFGFGVTIYALSTFPGVPAQPLLTVETAHLPQYSGGPKFDLGWEILSPMSHNPDNERLLKFHGFPELREKSYYDY